MTPWLDYGDVVSLPYDASVRAEVARMLDLTPDELEERYWPERPHLDRGLATAAYWSGVAGREVAEDEAARLDEVDLGGWGGLDQDMLALIEEQKAQGTRLALLSNAPHGQADKFDREPWLEGFEHLFASARLGLVKPDPAIYEHVLEQMGARPQEVTFVDDRLANVEAAAALGIRAIHFTGVADLRQQLH